MTVTELYAHFSPWLDYDPATGVFTWKAIPPHNTAARLGAPAGSVAKDGYVYVKCAGQRIYAHRLAFILMGEPDLPPVVDHKDGNRQNNAWANLRRADKVYNAANLLANRNTAGYTGVRRVQATGRYEARIRVNGKLRSLGMFDSPVDAHDTYCQAHAELNGEFSPYNNAVDSKQDTVPHKCPEKTKERMSNGT
jgi:hypothetical protein